MLDFYMIKDFEDSPEYPNECNYIGGLTLEEFDECKVLVIFCQKNNIAFDFFEDFRLNTKDVKILKKYLSKIILDKSNKIDEKVSKKIFNFLKEVQKNKTGIICFCD